MEGRQMDPEELVSLYKSVGAQYFMAMANHHDNMDLYNSKYQKQWNSTKIGPQKDLIAGWAKAARNNGLPFGVSVHASHAWMWYEFAQLSDKKGHWQGCRTMENSQKQMEKENGGKDRSPGPVCTKSPELSQPG